MLKKNSNKILLILDLDETLIYATRKVLDRPADFQVAFYQVYKRPGLDQFLSAVQANYLIAIWSSASDAYVEEVVAHIIPDDIPLEFVWGRSRCVPKRNIDLDEYGNYNEDYSSHYHFIKPMKKVKRLGYELERILIIDDTPHKSQRNYGNAIYPSPYHGKPEDDELGLLAKYLDTLKDKDNVRRLEKRNWRYHMTKGS